MTAELDDKVNDLPSNFDNCIFYNAIIKDDHPYDEWEVEYFANFAVNGLESQVSEYYRRSENIISKMRELGVDTEETWIEIDKTLIDPIFEIIDDDDDGVEVYKKTIEMLSTLEQRYEVI